MFITKKHLSRRTVLKNTLASLSLPFLDAMVPAFSSSLPIKYSNLACIYIPHGAVMIPGVMDTWTPPTTGKDFKFSPILKPLEPFRKYVTVVSGLRNAPAESPAPHAITPGTWLTCVHPPHQQAPDIGPSVDQVAAKHLSKGLPVISMELAGEGGGGACDPNFGCAYSGTIAFRTGTEPLPMIQDPRTVFTNLFGAGDTQAQRMSILHEQGSVLDFMIEETQQLRNSLGPADQRRIDSYLTSVRQIEQQIKATQQKFEKGNVHLPNAPAGIPDDYGMMLNTMFSLIKLAWQANMTRVATFMMAREVTMRTFPNLGISNAWHPLSHHHNDPVKLAKLTKVQHYMTQEFAKFVETLSKTEDGDGNLLDHSLILYGSNMSNSDIHNHSPLPEVIVGKSNSSVKGNQHLQFPEGTHQGNLLLTMLDRVGIPSKSIGDSNGILSEI